MTMQIYKIIDTHDHNRDFFYERIDTIIREPPKVIYYDDEKEFKPCENCNSQNREAIKISSPHPLACVPINVHGYLIPTGSIWKDKNTYMLYMLMCHDCGEAMWELSESEVQDNRIPKQYTISKGWKK